MKGAIESAARRPKIGRFGYSNLFPIFYMLERGADNSAYEFIEGVPSRLNRLLREGEIDISPSSSIEYLRHEEKYTLLEDHSISSIGPVRSVLLFSTGPMETLDGSTVLTSAQSETSVALLDIIFRKFYELDCTLKTTDKPLSKAIDSRSAYLLIGDDALRQALRWPKLHIYDLGDIWHKETGLPFVFALWIARRDFRRDYPSLLDKFKKDLDAAKSEGMKNLEKIAQDSHLKDLLSEDEIVAYWKGISYDLDEGHKRGLELFRRYAAELGLL